MASHAPGFFTVEKISMSNIKQNASALPVPITKRSSVAKVDTVESKSTAKDTKQSCLGDEEYVAVTIKGENPSLEGPVKISTGEVQTPSTDVEEKLMSPMSRLGRSLIMRAKSHKGQNYKTVLKIASSLASTGSSSRYGAYTFDPSGTTDWSDFNGLFDQFRVLEIKLTLSPAYRYFDTGYIVVAGDNDDATVPTTFDSVVQYANSKTLVIGSTHDLVFEYKRPNITASAYWVDVASPTTSAGAIKLACTETTSTNARLILWAITEYVVEFRQRR